MEIATAAPGTVLISTSVSFECRGGPLRSARIGSPGLLVKCVASTGRKDPKCRTITRYVAPSAPALSGAVVKQLGLQLLSKKLPFDVLVIDSVFESPTEN